MGQFCRSTHLPHVAQPNCSMSISVELPKDSRQFAVDTVGAAMCYKLLIKATEELSKVSPAYVAPISKPSAATAVCAIFGIKTPLPQPIENLIFKATFGTSLAVLAAEISLRVIGSAEATQREAAAVMAVALTYLLQKLVKFKGKIDALQVSAFAFVGVYCLTPPLRGKIGPIMTQIIPYFIGPAFRDALYFLCDVLYICFWGQKSFR